MFQATRRRLALWYTAVTAVLLFFLASGVYFYVRYTLIDRIDDTLKHVAEVVERSLVIDPVSGGGHRVNVDASFRQNSPPGEDDHIDWEWFSADGRLLWSTFPHATALPLHPQRRGETVRVTGDRWLRQVTARVALDQGREVLGYLRVSHPWFEFTQPIRRFTLDLILGTAAALGLVAGIGWLLSGLAMEPVQASYQRLKQFTADASHELRNPIAMIQTQVQTALAYPAGAFQDQEQQLQVIERLTRRLGRLVNDLLFLARADSGMVLPQVQPVPLDALLMEVVEEQRLFAQGQGVVLRLEIGETRSEEALMVPGDWDQLARLFTNVIANGVIYTAGVTDRPRQVTIDLQALEGDRGVRIAIQDTGIGIAEDQLPHLFERFYRGDPARSHSAEGGSGLGLAIAKAIVEGHRGHIAVSSQGDRGTCFTITLPHQLNQPYFRGTGAI